MVLSPHVHKTIRLNSSCIVENLNRLPSPPHRQRSELGVAGLDLDLADRDQRLDAVTKRLIKRPEGDADELTHPIVAQVGLRPVAAEFLLARLDLVGEAGALVLDEGAAVVVELRQQPVDGGADLLRRLLLGGPRDVPLSGLDLCGL